MEIVNFMGCSPNYSTFIGLLNRVIEQMHCCSSLMSIFLLILEKQLTDTRIIWLFSWPTKNEQMVVQNVDFSLFLWSSLPLLSTKPVEYTYFFNKNERYFSYILSKILTKRAQYDHVFDPSSPQSRQLMLLIFEVPLSTPIRFYYLV